MGKSISLFETSIHVLSNVYGEKCFNVIHEKDQASVSGVPFWDESDSEFSGWGCNDAVNKIEVYDTLF